jgi:hypothetical protein
VALHGYEELMPFPMMEELLFVVQVCVFKSFFLFRTRKQLLKPVCLPDRVKHIVCLEK